jgi:hypothetical protein
MDRILARKHFRGKRKHPIPGFVSFNADDDAGATCRDFTSVQFYYRGINKRKWFDAQAHRLIITFMDKLRALNLRLEVNLIAEMKIQAIRENRTVSEIATELFQEYLRKAKTKR